MWCGPGGGPTGTAETHGESQQELPQNWEKSSMDDGVGKIKRHWRSEREGWAEVHWEGCPGRSRFRDKQSHPSLG